MFQWNKTKLSKNFESEADGFSIDFPKEPTVETVGDASKYSARSGGVGFRIVIKYDRINFNTLDEKPAEILQRRLLQDVLDSLKDGEERGIVATENTSTFCKRPSANAIYQMPGMYTVARYFYYEDKLFHILVAHRKKVIAQSHFDAFVDTFTLIDATV